MHKRDAYFDLIKGLAITGVITIHFVGFNSGDLAVSLFRQLVCCAVPMFFFLSGYFVRIESHGVMSHIGRRLLRLAIPYLLITGLILCHSHPDHFLSIDKWLVHDILLGEGIGIGYFVVALAQLTILSPIIAISLKQHAWLTLFCCLVLNLLAITYFYLLCFGMLPKFGCAVPVPMPAVFFPAWIFYYSFGIYLKDNEIRIKQRIIWLVLILALELMYVEKWCISEMIIGISQLRGSAFLYSVCACCLVVMNRRKVSSFWGVLGRGSFFVYLTHMKFFRLPFGMFNYFGWSGRLTIGWYLLGLSVVVGVLIVFISFSERIMPIRIRKWIGVS